VAAQHDSCLPAATYVRALEDFNTFETSLHVIEDYGLSRGLSSGSATEWASCAVCQGFLSELQNGLLWGQASTCSDRLSWRSRIAEELRNGRQGTGSFIPDNAAVCFEGEAEYISAALTRTKLTPFGSVFTNGQVSQQTCEERGYAAPRDLIDECWPLASKFMRVETEDEDMGTWVGSYPSMISSFDVQHGQSEGTAMLQTSCEACEAGGATRDRGMWITWHGSESAPVTDEMCMENSFGMGKPGVASLG